MGHLFPFHFDCAQILWNRSLLSLLTFQINFINISWISSAGLCWAADDDRSCNRTLVHWWSGSNRCPTVIEGCHVSRRWRFSSTEEMRPRRGARGPIHRGIWLYGLTLTRELVKILIYLDRPSAIKIATTSEESSSAAHWPEQSLACWE